MAGLAKDKPYYRFLIPDGRDLLPNAVHSSYGEAIDGGWFDGDCWGVGFDMIDLILGSVWHLEHNDGFRVLADRLGT
jgi:hypothetical protein